MKQTKKKKEDTKKRKKKQRRCIKNHAISFGYNKNIDKIFGKVFNLDKIMPHFWWWWNF
jgi:CRISPR/Cas system-associated endonuclease Cas1